MSYSDFTNMSTGFTKVSKGYAMVSGRRFYCELWLAVGMLHIQTRIFLDKPYTVSHLCGTWRNANGYIFTNVQASTGGRWPRSNNDYVDRVIQDTRLQIFEESRKWLTPAEKEVAHMLAVNSIGILDAEELLATDVADMPQAFHEEVSRFRNGYNAYLNRQEQEDREMAEKLNTREGLSYLLRLAKRRGEHVQAVTFISQVIYDLTELWDK